MDQLTHPSVSSSNNPVRPPDRHAVVIGAGFGGLAAAIRLGARGYRVTVLDKLNEPGGRAAAFRQDGFTFDPGPTILTAPHLFEELWTLCGRTMADDLTLKSMEPFYRVRFDDGSTFDASGNPDAMRAEVARLSPSDVEGYERFMRHSEETCRIGFEQLGDQPFNSIFDMVKVAPDIIRLGGYRSVYSTVAKYIKDERLRIAFGFHPLFIGGNPFAVSSVYTMVPYFERKWGVHFPLGGTGAAVKGLAKLVEGQGSTIRCNTEFEQILVSNGRAAGVRLASGETIAADIVVSNADSAWTYRKMLPPEARKTWTDRKLDRSRYSMGLFIWYFGTNRQYPDVQHHTIALGPRYKGLLHDIFNRKVLAKDFSLYLHRPTATDPSLAPAGCDTFYVLSPVPNLHGKTDWTKEAEPYRQSIQKRLEETLLPDLGKHVVTSKVRTPVDFRDGLRALHGAAFSLEPVLLQSAFFRPHNKSEDVAGLYLVGAGTHPGAGVPAVISSAKVLDRVVPHAATL
ncbi:MAG: phytoene desaturase [Rhodopila sp.]